MTLEPFLIPFGDFAEQARIRSLCARLARNSPIRQGAEALLGGIAPTHFMIDQCIAALMRQGAPRWRERCVAAWMLGVIPLPENRRDEAAQCLARVIDNFDLHKDESGRLLRAAARTICALIVIVGVGLVSGELMAGLGFEDFLFTAALTLLAMVGTPPASFVWDHRCTNRVRIEAAYALGRLAAPRYLGALARGATDPSQEVRSASETALKRTLPAIRSGMEAQIPRDIGSKLCGVLKGADPALSVSILQALTLLGSADVIPTVERIAQRDRSESVRAAANSALPELYARRERDRQSEVLLRPSAPQDDAQVTLLRPVSNVGSSEPELLLRPTTGEETP